MSAVVDPIEVEVYGFTREVALGICKLLWIDRKPVNTAYEKYKYHFGSVGDFVVTLSRIAHHKEEIVNELKSEKI